MIKGTIRIGTSGIVLPGPKRTFPDEFQSVTRLNYYSTLFNTLEINSTFYKLPLPSTFEKWSHEVNEDFRFTCKLPRIITHAKDLCYQPTDIDEFMHASNEIGSKKGCLLIQFPASIKADRSNQVEKILSRVAEINDAPKWKICVEFRDMSWYNNDSVLCMLRKNQISIVMHDMPNSKTPAHLPANPMYVRFHGPLGDYKGSYTDKILEAHAVRIKSWMKEGTDVYVYFNNTIGEAFNNAQFLKALL